MEEDIKELEAHPLEVGEMFHVRFLERFFIGRVGDLDLKQF